MRVEQQSDRQQQHVHCTLRIQVCPNRKGLPRTIPILFGWDWSPKHPLFNREGSGSLGVVKVDGLATPQRWVRGHDKPRHA